MTIAQVSAHQILDSRGIPTVEVHLKLDNGIEVTASSPSGASIGKHEAVEIRDHNYGSYLGLSVLKAIKSVNEVIAPVLHGRDPTNQEEIDLSLIKLDGTADKSRLGGNAIMATSAAVTKAGAWSAGMPLFAYIAKLSQNPEQLAIPTPMFNLLNGGLHGTGNLDFQEFLLVPARRIAYTKALQMGDEVYLNLKDTLTKRALFTSVGDEGGFTPTLFTNVAALDLLIEAVRTANYSLGNDVFVALDVAANQLRHGDRYFIKDSTTPLSSEGLMTFFQNILDRYSILALEDPMAEDDRDGWKKITSLLGNKTLIISDDLTVTTPSRVTEAIADRAITAVMIKPNQIGTISEALKVSQITKEHQLTVIVSHRAGETDDTFIADFAVGIGADYFKGGAPARGERVAKYNRFLEIEVQIAAKVT